VNDWSNDDGMRRETATDLTVDISVHVQCIVKPLYRYALIVSQTLASFDEQFLCENIFLQKRPKRERTL